MGSRSPGKKDSGPSTAENGGANGLRIDSPHELSSADAHVRPKRRSRNVSAAIPKASDSSLSVPEPAGDPPAPPSLGSTADVPHTLPESSPSGGDFPGEILETQVRQLLGHLARRRRVLARRRKALALAKERFAAEVRSAQLALERRELALAERHRQLDQLAERLSARELELRKQEEVLAAERAELDRRSQELTQAEINRAAEREKWEEDLRRRQVELEEEYQGRLTELARRQEEWQARFQAEVKNLRQARELFEREKQNWQNTVAFERQRLAADQARVVELHRLLRDQVDKYRQWVEGQLDKRRRELQVASNELTRRQQAVLRLEEEIDARRRGLEEKARELEEIRLQLGEAFSEVDRLREALQARLRIVEEEAESVRLRLQQELAEQLAAVKDALERLRSQGETLARREAVLRQMEAELQSGHAQLFRERLLLEELKRRWIEGYGGLPAEGAERLCRQITEAAATLCRPEEVRELQHHLAQELARLEEMRREVGRLLEELAGRREELERWALARTAELAQSAGRLQSAWRELRRREAALRDLAQQWELQKHIFRREILLLRLRLLRAEVVAPQSAQPACPDGSPG